jgi:hypothetical protein
VQTTAHVSREVLVEKLEVDSGILLYKIFKYLQIEKISTSKLKQAFCWPWLSPSFVNCVQQPRMSALVSKYPQLVQPALLSFRHEPEDSCQLEFCFKPHASAFKQIIQFASKTLPSISAFL